MTRARITPSEKPTHNLPRAPARSSPYAHTRNQNPMDTFRIAVELTTRNAPGTHSHKVHQNRHTDRRGQTRTDTDRRGQTRTDTDRHEQARTDTDRHGQRALSK
eukprot:1785366-Alexandrium_andersonii.AAC.1